MRLFIIRHADPDYPNNTITPAGHLEAQALAERLKRLGLDHLYASPLGRAIHTMKYTADVLKLTHTIEEWTTELGELQATCDPWGQSCVWDVPGEILRDDRAAKKFYDDPAVIKTQTMIAAQSDKFLARHGYQREGSRYKIVKSNRDRIAVFCHGGFGLFWLAHLLGIPLHLMAAGFHLPPSSLTTILFDERSDKWAVPRCTGLGDVSHLYAAGLPVQPAGIKANRD